MTADLWEEGIPAEHPGLCVICSNYIRPGRSRIAPLIVSLPPDPASLYCRNGSFVDRGGHQVANRPRRWVHARCAPGLDEDALTVLAAERREVLAKMRREARIDKPKVKERHR